MKKEQKTQVIEELAAQLGEAQAIYAVDYRGISVPQAAAADEGEHVRERKRRELFDRGRVGLRAGVRRLAQTARGH